MRYWFRLEQISQVSKSLFFTVLQFFMRYRLLVKFSYFVKDVFRLFCFALHQKPTDWFWRKTVIMHGEKKTLCCYHGVITCAVLAHLPRSWHVDKTRKKKIIWQLSKPGWPGTRYRNAGILAQNRLEMFHVIGHARRVSLANQTSNRTASNTLLMRHPFNLSVNIPARSWL